MVEHVAEGVGDVVEVLLNAQEQEGIGAIAVNGGGLQTLERAQLEHGVGGVHRDGRQRYGEPGQQSKCGSAASFHELVCFHYCRCERGRSILPSHCSG